MTEQPSKQKMVLEAFQTLKDVNAPYKEVRGFIAKRYGADVSITDGTIFAAKQKIEEYAEKAGRSGAVAVPPPPVSPPAAVSPGTETAADRTVEAIRAVRRLVDEYGKEGVKKLVDAV